MRVALLSIKEDRPPLTRDPCRAREEDLRAQRAPLPDARKPAGARDPSRPVAQTRARRAGRVGRAPQRRRGDRGLRGFARVGGERGQRERRRRPQRYGPRHRSSDRVTRGTPHIRRTPGRGGSSAQARHPPSKLAGDALRDGPSGTFEPRSLCATPRRKQHAIRPVDCETPGLSSLPRRFSQSGRAPAGTRHPLPGFRGARPPTERREETPRPPR